MLQRLEDIENTEKRSKFLALVAEMESSTFAHPWSLEDLTRNQSYDYNHLYLATACGKAVAGKLDDCQETILLGYVLYSDVADDAELLRIAVADNLRGKGMGSTLMETMMQDLVRLNAEKLSLEVREKNASAIHLYEKFGLSKSSVERITTGIRWRMLDYAEAFSGLSGIEMAESPKACLRI